MNPSASILSTIGLVAAVLSALTFLPQVVHTWQTRSANGLSGPMLAIGASSMILWLVYGLYEHNLPILLGNAVNLLFTLLLVFFKHHFRRLGEPAKPLPAPRA
ncbi:SemiSWEET family transporter [Hymenobacter sp. H14-R3]|uniref:SemiSWEET family sugar transporter n=1 Tax=Hymenobacter sp. H14-R3 TaxID=3046308 RepID=UPI0024BBE788|nr:SemiSWEET family transporter [Hymenobacter sp. H14-R3]MDJ0365989.1 SemiSWEET family transporter [Hymenobacter sp. H14-R3]